MPVICLNPLPRLPLPHHNQCHLSLHPPFHSYPICLLFFRSPAQLISLHLPSRPPPPHTHTQPNDPSWQDINTHTQRSPPARIDLYMLDYVANWIKMIRWLMYPFWPTAVPHFSAFISKQRRGKVGQRWENTGVYRVISIPIHPFICWQTVKDTNSCGQKDKLHLTLLGLLRDVLLTHTSLITLWQARSVCELV